MTASSVTYTLVQATVPGPPVQYSVTATVTVSANMGTSLFVYRYSDQLYDHIATVLDVMTYPTTTPDPAFTYYRLPTVTKVTASAAEAVDFANTLASRLTTLATEYDVVATAFVVGTTTHVVPAP